MSLAARVVAVASNNGLQAVARACELLRSGADTLDAAVAGVTLVEDDPGETSVGYGGIPNEEGVVELDAAVMHGPTHRAGAVAALRDIRHAARLAQLVMQRTDHVLLAGDAARRFALAHGFVAENLLTDKARRIWLHWKQTLSEKDDWLPPDPHAVDPEVAAYFKLEATSDSREGQPDPSGTGQQFSRPAGTIHLSARNALGEISCVTTTSGLAFKIPGRVGDSPIVGAGLFVDGGVGSCGSTGRGEANILNVSSFAAVELMRGGMSPPEAGLEVLRRVARTTPARLRDDRGRPDFNLKFYLMAQDGRHAGVSMWGPAEYAVCDENGPRLEPCLPLYER